MILDVVLVIYMDFPLCFTCVCAFIIFRYALDI